jgi:hypothetical protein
MIEVGGKRLEAKREIEAKVEGEAPEFRPASGF